MAFPPTAYADSPKDIELLITYVQQTGTKVEKTTCDSNTLGFYQAPTEGGGGDRLVFCSNNIDFNDISAVWEVLAHESAHVMQACNGGLLWKAEYHPRMLRGLKEQAPHYAQILRQYNGWDKMMELEAFDMELRPASEVISLFVNYCTRPTNQNSQSTAQSSGESAESILSIVGGKESLNALLAWAEDNLSQQELKQLAQALESNNIPDIKQALIALMNQFNQAQSYESYRLF
ncbi:hypothetical protein [Synechococcus sp. UW179A]|uniref:hypothetical protein n=1 Tax=Synechococcus sp. UW179A TaxID=2575510 RepID=UPI0010BF347E|nr:hypothetical protein [Synechococcus sp. UW179A]